jgi:hypothetical protein
MAVDAARKRISLSMKKVPGGKPLQDKVDQPAAPGDGRKISPVKPLEHREKKRGKEAPKPFNNPFAAALKHREK